MSKTCKHYFDYAGLGKWTCRNCGEQRLTNGKPFVDFTNEFKQKKLAVAKNEEN